MEVIVFTPSDWGRLRYVCLLIGGLITLGDCASFDSLQKFKLFLGRTCQWTPTTTGIIAIIGALVTLKYTRYVAEKSNELAIKITEEHAYVLHSFLTFSQNMFFF